jgi:hypothetical protein
MELRRYRSKIGKIDGEILVNEWCEMEYERKFITQSQEGTCAKKEKRKRKESSHEGKYTWFSHMYGEWIGTKRTAATSKPERMRDSTKTVICSKNGPSQRNNQ